MASTSSTERTPLVQPTYVFESSLTRRYQKRLRNFQCAICVSLVALLGIALLVTVSYNLDNPVSEDVPVTNSTEEPVVIPLNLSLSATASHLEPLVLLTWPLKEQSPPPWSGNASTKEEMMSAIKKGKEELKKKQKLESSRKPLDGNSPAFRAQSAAATAALVKPMSDNAYAAEFTTRALLNGTELTKGRGTVGIGPPINGSFPEPPYCLTAPPPCPKNNYRSIDGTCNNLANPLKFGVANIPFRRVLLPSYGDGISSPRLAVDGSPLPSARDVSVTVHRPNYDHDIAFTVMLAVWGQFIDHDITATALNKGENSTSLSCCDGVQPLHPECFPVPLDVQDPFYEHYNLTCMEFVRSAPAPTCNFGPREQLNQATAFIDASTVYGSTEARLESLRKPGTGVLRMLRDGKRSLLPVSTDPNDGCNTAEMNAKGRYCFASGDDRANENLHLTTMHLIWARQHNNLAELLNKMNPTWSEDKVFFEARKIIGAQMQHITYAEFLPAILGVDVMWALNLTLRTSGFSSSYDPTVDPSIANHFSAAAFRFAHTLLPSLIHNIDSVTGSVRYTHLHEMLFNPYQLYAGGGPRAAVASAMRTPVTNVAPHVSNELTNHLFERPYLANSSYDDVDVPTSKPANPCGLDLVSLNIQRGRDHGLPSYPAWREHCGFPRPKSYEDLYYVFDKQSMNRIGAIYKNVDDIDLYTGALAEDPKGRLLGPTLTCLISDQFLRLKIGDRFWYETNDTEVGFTIEQLTEIRKTTLAGIICANEGLLDVAQARVMEEASPTNPLLNCKDLVQPDYTVWEENPPPNSFPTEKGKKKKY